MRRICLIIACSFLMVSRANSVTIEEVTQTGINTVQTVTSDLSKLQSDLSQSFKLGNCNPPQLEIFEKWLIQIQQYETGNANYVSQLRTLTIQGFSEGGPIIEVLLTTNATVNRLLAEMLIGTAEEALSKNCLDVADLFFRKVLRFLANPGTRPHFPCPYTHEQHHLDERFALSYFYL